VREKSPKTIINQCQQIYQNTGYQELSLSSLSSSDYTQLIPLLNGLSSWSEQEKISVSLPSLRVDGFSRQILEKLKTVRKTGLTFAPEAGTQRLRDVINKNVTEQELLKTCDITFAGGWQKIKLYFMMGLPTETREDIEGIANLAQKVVNSYYQNSNKQKGKSVQVSVSVACFVPKPFTPFQWQKQDSVKEFETKQKWLCAAVNSKKIKLNWHQAQTSFLEGIFARGDRKLCKVLQKAHQKGCKFDSWGEYFDFEKWMKTFEECNIDPHFYTKARDFKEVLPWDHLDFGIKKEFLKSECQKAQKGQTTPNCRDSCGGCGAFGCNFY
jgi:radical SAM family uncharacterized protein